MQYTKEELLKRLGSIDDWGIIDRRLHRMSRTNIVPYRLSCEIFKSYEGVTVDKAFDRVNRETEKHFDYRVATMCYLSIALEEEIETLVEEYKAKKDKRSVWAKSHFKDLKPNMDLICRFIRGSIQNCVYVLDNWEEFGKYVDSAELLFRVVKEVGKLTWNDYEDIAIYEYLSKYNKSGISKCFYNKIRKDRYIWEIYEYKKRKTNKTNTTTKRS
ncbi:hypothetical protein UT300012_23990 [Paraclostridium bifermentans]